MCPYAFVEIAPSTRESQIVEDGRATKCFGNHVFNMQRPPGDSFGTLAVFATMTCAFGDGLAQGWRDIRHRLSWVQTQIAWQDTAVFEEEERSGLAQRDEILFFN
jgi:hypothetical protein